MKTYWFGCILAVCFLGIFGVGFYAGGVYSYIPPIEGVHNTEEGQPDTVDFSLFWDAWRVVQEDYAKTEPLNFQAMIHGAIQGMVASLQDPYTNFMDANDTELFLEDVAGSFSGIGAEIGIRNNQLQIIAPLEGTPAERAGLRPGDFILRINDDTFTADLTIDEAVMHIRGPEGSTVVLNMFREGWQEPRDITIQRAMITIPSLRWEIQENNIAYVKIFQFSDQLREDFRTIERELIQSDGIVLDLRNNPGGFLHVAVDIAGYFLLRGDIVVIEDSSGENKQETYKSKGSSRLHDYKIVVLINGGSASASEILAGALKDNRDILLIGEQSFGKGSVQELKRLKDSSSIKLTVANWLTPKGALITGKGLTPDIEVLFTEEDFELARDPQLQKALEVLNNL